jgi:hypothetical protein
MTGDDSYDMIRMALMSRPMLSDEERIKHKPGTAEHSAEVAKALFEHNLDRMRREKDQKEGNVFDWNTDKNGVPSWNQWGE